MVTATSYANYSTKELVDLYKTFQDERALNQLSLRTKTVGSPKAILKAAEQLMAEGTVVFASDEEAPEVSLQDATTEETEEDNAFEYGFVVMHVAKDFISEDAAAEMTKALEKSAVIMSTDNTERLAHGFCAVHAVDAVVPQKIDRAALGMEEMVYSENAQMCATASVDSIFPTAMKKEITQKQDTDVVEMGAFTFVRMKPSVAYAA